MQCSTFAGMLADYQEGRLSPGELSDAETHLQNCETCRRLLAIARGNINILPDDQGGGLAHAILERTCGSPCPRVESSLCDYVDGKLEDRQSQLIALHLAHCVSCQAVADSLLILREELPEMAEIEPGLGFAREVVLATSSWRPFQPGVRTRLVAWWNRIVQRPRFSFEAAYVGTLVLVFAFGSPVVPLHNTRLEKLASTAIHQFAREAASKMMPSNLGADDAPALRLARSISSGAVQKEQSISAALNRLKASGEKMIEAGMDRQLAALKAWSRKASENLQILRSRLSKWASRSKA